MQLNDWPIDIFEALELIQILAGQFHIGVLRVCAASTQLV